MQDQSSLKSQKLMLKRQQQNSQYLSQSQPFIQSYKGQVLYPNILNLIFYTILVYVVYLVADIVMFNAEQLIISQAQQHYLTNLKLKFQIRRQIWLGEVRVFVDLYRQIMAMNINTIPVYNQCNSTRYICEGVSSGIWNSVEKHYELIKLNYYKLIKQSNTNQDAQIFIYYPLYVNPFLFYRFSNINNSKIGSLLQKQISVFTDSKYLYLLLNKYTTGNSSQVKLLICGKVPSVHQLAKICVISPGSLQDNLPNSNNPIKIINQKQINVYQNQIFYDNNQSNLQSLKIQKAKQIVNTFIQQQDQMFYNSYSLFQCINQFKKTQYLIKNKIRVCNPPQLFYFPTRTTIFFYSIIQMKPRYYLQDITSPFKLTNFQIKSLIFSNQSFYQFSNQKLKTFNKKQAYILQIVILIIVIWLICTPIFPLKLVNRDISLSVAILIKMCKAVKFIKNKDDLEQQIQVYNKLHAEISKINHVFYSTIQYFQYFIWHRKWLYTTKLSKKKSLLQQGLTLFGSADYAAVILYIYKKQIQNQVNLVQKYKKIRRILSQKFFVQENDDKILANTVKNKQKYIPKSQKKSGLKKSSYLIDEYNVQYKDFSMAQNIQKNIQNRINKNLQLMQAQKKNKRFVRFSNDLYEQNNKVYYRVSKFLLNIPNQSKLKNSHKTIQDEIKKKEKQQEDYSHIQSSRDDRNDLKDIQSEPSEKFYQRWDTKLKFDQSDQPSSIDFTQDECFDLKRFNLKKLDEKISQTYDNIFHTYQKIVVSKRIQIQILDTTNQINDQYNQLYEMLIQKLHYIYKYVKQKNYEREKILKQLNRKIINVKRQKIGIKDLYLNKQRFFGSKKCLHDTISVIEEQLQVYNKLIDLQFKEFISIQERHNINPDLLEKAKLYQIKLLKIINYPIPYKELQKLCQSKNSQIRVQAKIILAQQFYHLSPHADYQIIIKVEQNLNQPKTTHSQKQKTLKLIESVFRNREIMQQFVQQIQLIKNHYNYSHKKIYFVADLTDNYQIFRPVLQQIYKNMDNVDIYQIMNLAMNQNLQDMAVGGTKLKPSKLHDFQTQFENLHDQMNKTKSMASSKASRRITLQKDFNKIMNQIQFQNIDLSKFIVLILGGENETQNKTYGDYESTSVQNRQQFQQIHQQILAKISRNYFHVILIGFNLKDTQTRQGKLKKYIRQAHDVIQIDLCKANYKSLLKDLSKFMDR